MRLTRQKHNETMGFEHEHVMAKAASDGDEQAEARLGPGTGQESAPLVGVEVARRESLGGEVQPVEAVPAEPAVQRSICPVHHPRHGGAEYAHQLSACL